MSIIAEALKKAGGSSRKKEHIKSENPEERKEPAHNYVRLAGIFLFILVAGTVIYLLSPHSADVEPHSVRALAPFSSWFRRVAESRTVPQSGTGARVKIAFLKKPLQKETVLPRPIGSTPKTPDTVIPAPHSGYGSYETYEALKLTGIMYTQEKPLAVINNAVWKEGDSIGDFRIVKIGTDYIKVRSGEEEMLINLKR